MLVVLPTTDTRSLTVRPLVVAVVGEGGEESEAAVALVVVVVVVSVVLAVDESSSATTWSASLGLNVGLPGVTAARGVKGVDEVEAAMEESTASGVGRAGEKAGPSSANEPPSSTPTASETDDIKSTLSANSRSTTTAHHTAVFQQPRLVQLSSPFSSCSHLTLCYVRRSCCLLAVSHVVSLTSRATTIAALHCVSAQHHPRLYHVRSLHSLFRPSSLCRAWTLLRTATRISFQQRAVSLHSITHSSHLHHATQTLSTATLEPHQSTIHTSHTTHTSHCHSSHTFPLPPFPPSLPLPNTSTNPISLLD